MKRIIGYILMSSPLIVGIVALFIIDWKMMLIVIGALIFFGICFLIGSKVNR